MTVTSGLYELDGRRLSRQTLAAMVLRGEVEPETVVTDPAGNRARAGDAVSDPEIRELFDQAVSDYFSKGFLSDAERALDIISRLTRGLAVVPEASLYLGVIAFRRGFLGQSQDMFTRLLDSDDARLKCIATNNLGVVAAVEGRFDDAQRWLVESVRLARRARIPNPVFNLDFLASKLLKTPLVAILGSESADDLLPQPDASPPTSDETAGDENDDAAPEPSPSPAPAPAPPRQEPQSLLQWAAAIADRYEPLCLVLHQEISTAALDQQRMRQRLSVEHEVDLARDLASAEQYREAWRTIRPILDGPPELVSDEVRQAAEEIRTGWAAEIIRQLKQAVLDADLHRAKTLLVELKECDENLHDRWDGIVEAMEYAGKVRQALQLLQSPETVAEGLVRLRDALATYSAADWDLTEEEWGELFLADPHCQQLLREALELWTQGRLADAQDKLNELVGAVQERGWQAEDAQRLSEALGELLQQALELQAETQARREAQEQEIEQVTEAIEEAERLYIRAQEALTAGQTADGLRLLKQAIDRRKEADRPAADWDRELADWARRALARVEHELLPAGKVEQAETILDAVDELDIDTVAPDHMDRLRKELEKRQRQLSLPAEVRKALAEAAAAFREGRPARAYDLLKALPPQHQQEEPVAEALSRYRAEMTWWQRLVRGA